MSNQTAGILADYVYKESKMENKCSAQSGSCETHEEQSRPAQSSSCCPVEKVTEMWGCAFHQAMKEVHVDILKAKIHKAWGPKMEKMADAVLEAMGVQWESMLAQGKAKVDLKEKITRIMTEGKK